MWWCSEVNTRLHRWLSHDSISKYHRVFFCSLQYWAHLFLRIGQHWDITHMGATALRCYCTSLVWNTCELADLMSLFLLCFLTDNSAWIHVGCKGFQCWQIFKATKNEKCQQKLLKPLLQCNPLSHCPHVFSVSSKTLKLLLKYAKTICHVLTQWWFWVKHNFKFSFNNTFKPRGYNFDTQVLNGNSLTLL